MLRSVEYSLAGLWLVCGLLTALEWVTPIEIVSHLLRAGAHSGLVLLFLYPVSQLLGGSQLTNKLLGWLAGLAGGTVALFGVLVFFAWPFAMILLLFGWDVATFFVGGNPWRTEYVHFQRGQEQMVSQVRPVSQVRSLDGSHIDRRTVRLTPLTPLLQWVRPVPPAPPGRGAFLAYDFLSQATTQTPGYAGWTRVAAAHQASEHVQDSAISQRADAAQQAHDQAAARQQAARLRCTQRQRTEDSLAQLGRLPAWTLPAVTRQGANTFGCWLGPQLWRDYALTYREDLGCSERDASGSWDRRQHTLELRARMRCGPLNRAFNLVIPAVTRPGSYQLGRYDSTHIQHYWAFKDYLERPTWYVSAGMQVRLTRFDTVTRVAAGTFQGYLYRYDTPGTLLPVQQGRFDVQF